MAEIKAPDITDPPDIAVRFIFWGDKWDHEYARNVLLHYIAERGLADDCEKWLTERFPDEREP